MLCKTQKYTKSLHNDYMNKNAHVYRNLQYYLLMKKEQKKREPLLHDSLDLNLAVPIFPGRYQPSIFGVVDFTSVFGMRTGVSPQLCPPENLLERRSLNEHISLKLI